MDTIRLCNGCGTPLIAGAPEGLCPKCLLKAAMVSGSGSSIPGSATPGVASALPDPAALAKYFPQLEIIELLGQGGMGAVYKARQPGLDRFVALKILPPNATTDAGFAERFNREARALARLNHPNIVAVYDFGQTHGLHYFIMEFVDGANLRQLEASAKLAPREALKIIPQICDALQFAHNEGIVHRDIKPENVLLDKKGRVKIADFGLARILGHEAEDARAMRLTGARDIMGTPHYMAPEQVSNPQEVDHRADIYSLGVVFYEMLTGELPMGRFAPPSKKVEVDVRLDEVVLRTLEREPARRYQHASEIKTDVDTISGLMEGLPAHLRRMIGFEYRSKITWFGLPLLHVTSGLDPKTGRPRTARGIIAIGDRAQGLVAIGGLAFGAIAFGGLAVGVISVGGLAIGLGALGGCALGLMFAYGGLAIAPIVWGGLPFAMNFTILALMCISAGIATILPRFLREKSAGLDPVKGPIAQRVVLGIMAGLIVIVALVVWFRPSHGHFETPAARTKVLDVQLDQLAKEGQLLSGAPVLVDGRWAVRIENTNNAPLQVAVFILDHPPVTSVRYALSGEIKYEHIEGEGYLEMWNVFAPTAAGLPEQRSFSRTVENVGPGRKITGTSDWRPFSLPFNRTGTTNGPSRLEVNVFLPSRGTLFLAAPKLTES